MKRDHRLFAISFIAIAIAVSCTNESLAEQKITDTRSDDGALSGSPSDHQKSNEDTAKNTHDSPTHQVSKSFKNKPTNVISLCVKNTEAMAPKAVPEYVEFYCKYDKSDKKTLAVLEHQDIWDKVPASERIKGAGAIHDQIHSYHKDILEKYKDKPMDQRCHALVADLSDTAEWEKKIQKTMKEHEAKQQALIADYKKKQATLSHEEDKALKEKLIAAGVVLHKDGAVSLSKYHSMAHVAHWTNIVKENEDAFTWGKHRVERCRKNPKHFLGDEAPKNDNR